MFSVLLRCSAFMGWLQRAWCNVYVSGQRQSPHQLEQPAKSCQACMADSDMELPVGSASWPRQLICEVPPGRLLPAGRCGNSSQEQLGYSVALQVASTVVQVLLTVQAFGNSAGRPNGRAFLMTSWPGNCSTTEATESGAESKNVTTLHDTWSVQPTGLKDAVQACNGVPILLALACSPAPRCSRLLIQKRYPGLLLVKCRVKHHHASCCNRC